MAHTKIIFQKNRSFQAIFLRKEAFALNIGLIYGRKVYLPLREKVSMIGVQCRAEGGREMGGSKIWHDSCTLDHQILMNSYEQRLFKSI